MTGYDNTTYWQSLHRKLPDKLSTVGRVGLSESYNRLKYGSEAEAVTAALEEVLDLLARPRELTALSIGCGNGIWMQLIREWLQGAGTCARFTALDISPVALESLSARIGDVEALCRDLKTVDPALLKERFHLVYAFYCLHHITRMEEFANALQFSARSVAPGGVLLIMDPVLSLPYSPFDRAPSRNGMPRRLALLDEMLAREGFSRMGKRAAISFILNSPIEAPNRAAFALCHALWRACAYLYRSDSGAALIGSAAASLDRWCKRRPFSYSSSLCIYRKSSHG